MYVCTHVHVYTYICTKQCMHVYSMHGGQYVVAHKYRAVLCEKQWCLPLNGSLYHPYADFFARRCLGLSSLLWLTNYHANMSHSPQTIIQNQFLPGLTCSSGKVARSSVSTVYTCATFNRLHKKLSSLCALLHLTVWVTSPHCVASSSPYLLYSDDQAINLVVYSLYH